MEHAGSSDAELMAAAQSGDASGYAMLLYRHGSAVRAAVSGTTRPVDAVTAVFLDGMRQLPDRDPDEPVRPWLLALADQRASRGTEAEAGPPGGPDADDLGRGELDADERDLVWRELALRWPDGRRRHRVPAWVGWSALVVVLVGLGALVPYLVLTNPMEDEPVEPDPELVAVPWSADDDDREAERQPAPELFGDEELGSLPEIQIESDDEPSRDVEATSPPEVAQDPRGGDDGNDGDDLAASDDGLDDGGDGGVAPGEDDTADGDTPTGTDGGGADGDSDDDVAPGEDDTADGDTPTGTDDGADGDGGSGDTVDDGTGDGSGGDESSGDELASPPTTESEAGPSASAASA